VRVDIVTTGGTIASRIDPATGAAVPAVRAADLLVLVPQLGEIALLRTTEFCLESSWNVTPAMVADLARRIAARAFPVIAIASQVAGGTCALERMISTSSPF